MQLPDHHDLHGCVKVILGDILECSLVDILALPFGSRIHARWDTIIGGDRRTIRMTFDDKPGRGSAQTQLEEHRPAIRSYFENEERMLARLASESAAGEQARDPATVTADERGNVIHAIEVELKRIEARTGNTLFDAATQEACQRIRQVIARGDPASQEATVPDHPLKQPGMICASIRRPMPYIVPGAVRVCLISDAECSRGCGDGPCKEDGDGLR